VQWRHEIGEIVPRTAGACLAEEFFEKGTTPNKADNKTASVKYA
jgi:hypothetical protein